MAGPMSAQDKLALIYENLHEKLKEEIIEDVIIRQDRSLKIYWGTATTGRPHCGYFVPMVKLAHFLRAGCTIKILLADMHAFLDNLKAPIELVKYRAEYYRFVITSLLKSLNVPIDRLEVVLGSSYQLSAEYTMDLYRLCSVVSEHDAKKAGAEVVKQVANPLLSGLIYPLMQTLDEQYLDVDAQFGGVDQRKIFTLATESLPKINYKERAHLMNPMVPGLSGGKMSASDPDSKIDLLDPAAVVEKKLKKAHCAPKEVEGNGMISFVEFVLLSVDALKNGGKGRFVVERRKPEDGEPLVYEDIATLKEDYEADKLTPQLLKPAIIKAVVNLLQPLQEEYLASAEWQEIANKAYPPPETKKKEKKVKDRGTKFPGSKGVVEAKPDGHVEGEAKDQVNLGTGAAEAMENLDIHKKALP
ncbi:Tyrosine--tRNA ligase cytoplasmic, variant 2 [Xanthoria calcicola]